MEINLKFMKDQPAGAKDDNIIFVELYGSSGEKMENNDIVLSSRIFIPGKETEFVTIKPK